MAMLRLLEPWVFDSEIPNASVHPEENANTNAVKQVTISVDTNLVLQNAAPHAPMRRPSLTKLNGNLEVSMLRQR